ncbi:VOC family protein [Burkholderia guangdongensis]|uniref:VOC family protein n=1 Tax=Burkholderia guangdongensis TaxID=1792500 RepID=UPI0015CE49E9|nr:VOC family protein [Burkholderia guangdongensis]
MSARVQRITPFLWFDREAEAAATFYVSVFDHARITRTVRYGKAGAHASGQTEGAVMTVAFELDGQSFVALNGGPAFQIGPAVSFVVNCVTQAEIDHYWTRLAEGGDERAQQCGWLKDRFGVSWQIVPVQLPTLVDDGDPARAQRVMEALLQMKKIDLAALQRAAA